MGYATIPASDLRRDLHGVLARGLDRPLFVTTRGRAVAVLLDIEAYERLVDRIDDLEDARDPATNRALAEARSARREDLVPLEDVRRENGVYGAADEERS